MSAHTNADTDTVTAPGPRRDDIASPDAETASSWEIVLLAAGLLLVVGLAPFNDLVLAQVLLLGLVLVVPGVLLLRAIGLSRRPLALLCVPASLTLLLAIGIVTSQVGPALGVVRPLRGFPQLITLESVCLVFLVLVGHRTLKIRGWGLQIPDLPRLPHPLVLAPLLLPALGFLGARQLNAAMSPIVAIAALLLAILALGLVVWYADRLDDALIATTLAGVSLTLLWSFSLRSEVVFGYDVVSEVRKMTITAYTGQWGIVHVADAYGAMISVTVLPTQLTELTGIELLQLVKLVYPAMFAIAPPILYYTCRALLPSRWAFVGAAVPVVQANFGQQMPALARQEIALILFAATLYVLIAAREVSIRARYALLVAFALAVVVTHYSTTYLAIPIAGISLLLMGVLVATRRTALATVGPLTAVFVALTVGALLWNVVLTRSAANVGETFSSLGTKGVSVLGNGSGGGFLSTYLQGAATPNLSAQEYEQGVREYYAAERSYLSPLPQASNPAYELTDVPRPPLSPWTVASFTVTFLTRQIAFLAALVGVVLMLRNSTKPEARLAAGLGVGTIIVLIAIRLSSTIAGSYNQERALMQALFVLAPAIGWAGYRLASMRPSWAATAASVTATIMVALQLAGSSTLIGLPGERPGVNISNQSEDYQRYFSSWGEMTSAQWLGERADPKDFVYADRYGSLRFQYMTGRYDGVFPDIIPAVIDRNAWIYATTSNLRGTTRSQTDGKFGIYTFPRTFLDENFDVMYSNGLSEVYRRSTPR